MKRFIIPIILILLSGIGFLGYWEWTHFTLDLGKVTDKDFSSPLITEKDFPPAIIEKLKKAAADRDRIRKQYPGLFEAVSNAMFKNDPIGMDDKTSTDEYDLEAGLVCPRLKNCSSPSDITQVLFQTFAMNYESKEVGNRSHYVGLGNEIWKIWIKARAKQKA